MQIVNIDSWDGNYFGLYYDYTAFMMACGVKCRNLLLNITLFPHLASYPNVYVSHSMNFRNISYILLSECPAFQYPQI